MSSIGGEDETHLTFKARLVPVHSAGEVRVLPLGSARFPSLGELRALEESCDDGHQEMLYASDNLAKIDLPDVCGVSGAECRPLFFLVGIVVELGCKSDRHAAGAVCFRVGRKFFRWPSGGFCRRSRERGKRLRDRKSFMRLLAMPSLTMASNFFATTVSLRYARRRGRGAGSNVGYSVSTGAGVIASPNPISI